MSTEGWTDEQRSRIEAFNNSSGTDPSFLADEPLRKDNDTASPVAVKECKKWRTDLRENSKRCAYDIATENDRTPEAVRRHAYGRCSHPEHAVGEPANGLSRKGGRGCDDAY